MLKDKNCLSLFLIIILIEDMESTSDILVSIVEDNPLLRLSLSNIIDTSEGFEVLSSYTNAEEVLDDLAVNASDVLLLDIDLPGISGIEAISKIIKIKPDLNILILTID